MFQKPNKSNDVKTTQLEKTKHIYFHYKWHDLFLHPQPPGPPTVVVTTS